MKAFNDYNKSPFTIVPAIEQWIQRITEQNKTIVENLSDVTPEELTERQKLAIAMIADVPWSFGGKYGNEVVMPRMAFSKSGEEWVVAYDDNRGSRSNEGK